MTKKRFKRLVNSYAKLVLAGRMQIEDVPKKYRYEVELRVAELEIEKLS